MQMVLVAEMLDPVDHGVALAVGRPGDAEMLGARADRLRAGGDAAVGKQPGREEVDRRLAEPRGDIDVARALVDLARRADLDQPAVARGRRCGSAMVMASIWSCVT